MNNRFVCSINYHTIWYICSSVINFIFQGMIISTTQNYSMYNKLYLKLISLLQHQLCYPIYYQHNQQSSFDTPYLIIPFQLYILLRHILYCKLYYQPMYHRCLYYQINYSQRCVLFYNVLRSQLHILHTNPFRYHVQYSCFSCSFDVILLVKFYDTIQ